MKTTRKYVWARLRVRNFFVFLILAAALICIAMVFSGCGSDENEVTEEIGDIIFDNDELTITAVSTDEYLEVYTTKEIKLAYFAKDPYPVMLNLGGTMITVIQGDKLYDELCASVLTVYEKDHQVDITDMLEEFYVAVTDKGYTVYYEVYHEYDEEVDGDTLKKYVTLKAYRIDFKNYDSIDEQIKQYI